MAFKGKKISLAILAAACLFLLAAPAVMAQFGLPVPGLSDVLGGKKKEEKPNNVATEAVGGPGLAQATTFRNNDRQFEFTIPAGWRKERGEPDSDNCIFMKPGTTVSFQFHYTQMVPSFPAEASVQASLKQSKEMITIKKILTAKRRDDKDKKGDRKLGVRGWEIVQAPKGADGGFQRVIWQCYDGENYYFNFMTAAEVVQFEPNRAEMQQIIDSIKFRLK